MGLGSQRRKILGEAGSLSTHRGRLLEQDQRLEARRLAQTWDDGAVMKCWKSDGGAQVEIPARPGRNGKRVLKQEAELKVLGWQQLPSGKAMPRAWTPSQFLPDPLVFLKRSWKYGF